MAWENVIPSIPLDLILQYSYDELHVLSLVIDRRHRVVDDALVVDAVDRHVGSTGEGARPNPNNMRLRQSLGNGRRQKSAPSSE